MTSLITPSRLFYECTNVCFIYFPRSCHSHLYSGRSMAHRPIGMSSPQSLVMTLGLGRISKSISTLFDPYFLFLTSNRYFHKFESYSPHPRFPGVDASEHGASGPMTIGYHAHFWKGSEMFIQASVNVGIPFSPDFNTRKGTLGVNKVGFTVFVLHIATLIYCYFRQVSRVT